MDCSPTVTLNWGNWDEFSILLSPCRASVGVRTWHLVFHLSLKWNLRHFEKVSNCRHSVSDREPNTAIIKCMFYAQFQCDRGHSGLIKTNKYNLTIMIAAHLCLCVCMCTVTHTQWLLTFICCSISCILDSFYESPTNAISGSLFAFVSVFLFNICCPYLTLTVSLHLPNLYLRQNFFRLTTKYTK